jgi:hypothetical protein
MFSFSLSSFFFFIIILIFMPFFPGGVRLNFSGLTILGWTSGVAATSNTPHYKLQIALWVLRRPIGS